jgi:CheY-like chemotaxis protein
MEDLKYCVCCDEDVPYHSVTRDERQEIICSNCGFPLEVKETWEEPPEIEEQNAVAFVAEDSDVVRNIIAEMLNNRKFVGKVISCEDGAMLLRAVTDIYKKNFEEKKSTKGFAIIDLNMPVMDGLTAARSIRSLEEKNRIDKLPIIFFSSIIANEKIRSMLKSLAPAVYINKGKTPDKSSLIERVDTLLNYIGDKYLSNSP